MKRYNVTAIAPNRTLASGIASGAGSLDLDSAPAGAPATPFQIAVWEEQGDGSYSRSEMEVMEVTAISGATLTLGERGMEGTSARSFSLGALVTIGLWTPSQLDHAIGFEEDAGEQSGTYEWDVDASPHLRIELTGDLTINATGIRNGRRVVLLLIQDSTGGRSLTLGDGFATANGEQLDISTDADAISALGGFTSGGAVIIDVGKSEAPSGDLQVQTDAATGLDAGTATLNGELIALPDGETAQAAFEYRKTSGGVWTVTEEQALTAAGSFDEALTGLDEEEHEFRARAESAGLIEVGNVLTFTPESASIVTGSIDFGSMATGNPIDQTLLSDFFDNIESTNVIADAEAISGNIGQIDTVDAQRWALKIESLGDSITDVEVLVRGRFNENTDGGQQIPDPAARISGASGNENLYRGRVFRATSGTQTLTIDKYTNGSFERIGSASTPTDNIVTGDWWFVRFTIVGNELTSKVWREATQSEADADVIVRTDNDHASGAVGVAGFASDASLTWELDYITWSTDPNNQNAPIL